MPLIETIPAGQATGPVREMYQRQQEAFGYVPNYAKVFSHRPELMTLWADLQRGIRRHVTPERYELVTLAAALALRSSSCSLAFGAKVADRRSPAAVVAVADEVRASSGEAAAPAGTASLLTAAERVMVRYAARVARDAVSVTAEDVAGLRCHGFCDAEIFDIAISAAARAFFTKVLDGLGAAPDAAFCTVDAAIRDVAEGRPIDTAAPELL